jgi:hypothetical protein
MDRRLFLEMAVAGSAAMFLPNIASAAEIPVKKQATKSTPTPIQEVKPAEQPKPIGKYAMKWIPKGPGEILMETGLNQGDMLFIAARKLWVGTTGAHNFDQTRFRGGMVLAAVRAATDIKSLPITMHGDLQIPMSGVIEPARSRADLDQQRDFANLVRQRVEDLRIPGRGCLVGCSNLRVATFTALDVVQPSGSTIVQLKRSANSVFMS